jgi:endonuclease YncB( thermonuclease family)
LQQLTASVVIVGLAIGAGAPVLYDRITANPETVERSQVHWELRPTDVEASMSTAADEEQWPLSLAPRIGEIVPFATRDVTPPGITPGPPVTGPLVRVPSPIPRKPRRKPAPRTQRLLNPEIPSAGTLLTSSELVQIAGIEAPQLEATCGTGDQAWPCGVVAREQLRRFIRGRAIGCEIPPGADELPEITRCRVSGRDIGEWLVLQGWAKPSGPVYTQAGAEAARARRGIWGRGSRPANSVCISNC